MKKWILTFTIVSGMFLYGNENIPSRLLNVSGTGKSVIKAQEAFVRLAVEVNGQSPEEVQDLLAVQVNKVLEALRKGKAQHLQTQSMQIEPQYNKKTPPEIVSYKGTRGLTFTFPAVDVGPLLDATVKSGANRIDSVTLKASDGEVAEARGEALKLASDNALNEAKIVLKALGLELKEIVGVNIDSTPGVFPRAMNYARVANASTEVVEGEQEISATLQLTIQF